MKYPDKIYRFHAFKKTDLRLVEIFASEESQGMFEGTRRDCQRHARARKCKAIFEWPTLNQGNIIWIKF